MNACLDNPFGGAEREERLSLLNKKNNKKLVRSRARLRRPSQHVPHIIRSRRPHTLLARLIRTERVPAHLRVGRTLPARVAVHAIYGVVAVHVDYI